MALMTEPELDKIWDALWVETSDRSKGSFKRTLWYGGKRSTMVGFDKGARKAIRNAPRKLLTLGVKQIPEVGSILAKVSDPAAGAVKKIYSKYVKPSSGCHGRSEQKPRRPECGYRENLPGTVR